VDTWKWDGTSWTELHPVHLPELWQPAMAYDPNRHQVVLYGPDRRSPSEWQTWTWDGNDWSLHSASPNPGRWVKGTMGYDQAIGEVILFGGLLNSSPLPDSFDRTAVWGWDGSRWTNLPDLRAPSATSTPPTRSVTFTSEPDTGRLVIYACDPGAAESTIWAWNRAGWSDVTIQPAPHVNIESHLFSDASGHRSILFGQVYTGPLSSSLDSSNSWYEVWRWDDSSWAQLG
jgi:hypothetical protein